MSFTPVGSAFTFISSDSRGNTVVSFSSGSGYLKTGATGGFLYVPHMSGAPNNTGATGYTGMVAMCFDTVNSMPWFLSTRGVQNWVSVLPTGVVLPYVNQATVPNGFLLCEGAAVSRTVYANLFLVIGTAYGIGDGSTTFNLPDMRGNFMRGRANASANDPDRASRTATNSGNSGDNVGSNQGYQIQSHTHNVNWSTTGTPTGVGLQFHMPFAAVGGTTASALATGGNQTNPINLYFVFIIKT